MTSTVGVLVGTIGLAQEPRLAKSRDLESARQAATSWLSSEPLH
jgi:hypothetical protein